MISILSANTYYFPKAEVIDKASFVLSLYSDLSKTNKDFQVSTNPGVSSSKYYPIVITQELIDSLNSGEYNYTLKDGDLVASKGLLRIVKDDDGEYDPETDYVIWGEDVDWITTDMVNGDALWQSGYTSGWTDASVQVWEDAYNSGYTDGYSSGYSQGYADGVEDASEEAFESGYTVGYQDGYESGSTDGYQEGFDAGYDTGYEEGYQAGRLSVRDFFSMKALSTGATIGIRLREQTSASTQNIQYSLDKLEWHDVDLYESNISLQSGQTIFFKGNNPTGLKIGNSYLQFVTEGQWECGGDLTTLLNEVGGLKKLNGYGTYYSLFDSTNIVTAPDLSVDETDMYSYNNTFNNCRYLKNVLPIRINNMINGTFRYTFVGCTSLESVTLCIKSATRGYDTLLGTFKDCTSLSAVTSYFEEFYTPYEEPQTKNWLANVAPTGRFYNIGGYQFEKDSEDGIPSGWTEYVIQEPVSGGSWESGYQSGYTDGKIVGYDSGWTGGYSSGVTDGKEIGYNSGYTNGYSSGVTDGEEIGYNSGYTNGYSSGHTDGYQEGYEDGVEEGSGEAYSSGWTNGYASGTTDGKEIGYQSGWTGGYNSGATDGFESGYQSGTTDGFETGYSSGRTDGYDAGIEDGYGEGYRDGQYHGRLIGYQSGFTAGYGSGSTDGYNSGLTVGYDSGYTTGYNSGHTDGYSEGYDAGFEDGYESGSPITYDTPLMFMAKNNTATVGMNCYGTARPVLEYSLDNRTTWHPWDYSTITLGSGETVYFKGINSGISSSVVDVAMFTTTGGIYVCGNIMSLLDGCAASTSVTINQDFCFYGLFSGSTVDYNILNKLKLPATTLAFSCYERMFEGCTSLGTAPKLPATTLAGHCYNSMFLGCTSLTSVPELPAKTLAESCYQNMFDSCTSLIDSIKLPATTLKEGCYFGMFANCTSLNNILTFISIYATDISASMCLTNWLYNTGSSVFVPKGSIMNYGNAEIPSGNNGIPAGWKAYRMQQYTPS